jgi:thiol-disulfide isomerase/thioredoxin
MLSCGNNKIKKEERTDFTIKGKLKNTRADIIKLEYLKIDSLKKIDSVKINDNGEFEFKHIPEGIGFYLIKVSNDNFIMLLAEKGEDITISGDIKQLASDYSVNGSKGSELLSSLNKHLRYNYKKVDSLKKLLDSKYADINYSEVKKEVDSVYQTIFNDQKKYLKSFIDNNPTSLASIMALYQVFGRQKVLNEKDDYEYFEKLDKSLFQIYPASDYVKELHQRVEGIKKEKEIYKQAEKKLDSGLMAPEINMYNIGGRSTSLSSFRGRVVLIFFWAGWSEPSIKTVQTLKWIYKQYNKKGFEIYAVSLDKHRQTWEDAIRRDKIFWTHVSDLAEWNSPIVKQYCVKSIPYMILIDKQGRIVKRDISEKELPDYLYRLYKK